MDVPREQFDSLLGGKEELPSIVSVAKFVNSRCQEISALTEAIEDPQNKHLAFQKMPKHLRRRAMSHNVKRMPRRLREVHLNQLEKSGLPVKGKRPSRKYRRRPNSLLKDYNRRAAATAWLETHIWHAKRFHMVRQWGYCLPQAPTNKGFRACYRASARHCLLQDMSYLNCIELQGLEADILLGLSQLTSTECGLTFAAKCTLSGTREGNVTVYKRGSYPLNAIGRVTFMWRPEKGDLGRTIWIWTHPAFYKELVEELITVFGFKIEESTEMEVDANEDVIKDVSNLKRGKTVDREKLATRNSRNFTTYLSKNVRMALLKDTLNRFRLTGPLAQAILTEALKFVSLEDFIKSDTEKVMDVDDSAEPRSSWLCYFYKNDTHLQSLQCQRLFWQNILQNVNSAGELPPKMILSAVVMDPRLSMPITRTKAVNTSVVGVQVEIPKRLSDHSPLWEYTVRELVSHSKMATAQLNQLRSRALVPGLATPVWLGLHNVAHLPVLLVQNRGSDRKCGYGNGWDIILPAEWGMPVWLGLVYRGARAGGLRETMRLTLETSSGAMLFPDTEAGRLDSEQLRKKDYEKHFRLPPDKRPNYIKLGVIAPFHCPWKELLQDWHTEGGVQDFYVIRHRGQLEYLNCLLNQTKPSEICTFSEKDKACGLVQVEVEICGNGTLGKCSLICALNKRDIRLMRDNTNKAPTEPIHEDKNEAVRKILKEEHQLKLKRLRKKRVKAKHELEERGEFSVKRKEKKSPTEDLVREQSELMRELWLPSEIKSVKNSCSRCVIGFVTCGDFSFTQSRVCGYGFVVLPAFLSVVKQSQGYFLVRKITSLQYSLVRMKLLLPI